MFKRIQFTSKWLDVSIGEDKEFKADIMNFVEERTEEYTIHVRLIDSDEEENLHGDEVEHVILSVEVEFNDY